MASFRFKPFVFLVTLFGMCARIVSSQCPAGWVGTTEYTFQCYKIFDKETYCTARSTCETSLPGFRPYLALTDRLAETEFLYRIFQDYVKTTNDYHGMLLWIGMEDVDPISTKGELWHGSIYFDRPIIPICFHQDPNMGVALIVAPELTTDQPKYILVTDTSMKLPFVCEIQLLRDT